MSRGLIALATAALTTICAGFGAAPANAQGFPSRPVTLIVPFAVGSGTDVTARIYGVGLEAELKQSILIDNRPGAAGSIGLGIVAKANADGHTLLFLGGGSLSKTFRKEMPADLLADLTPVIQLTKGANFLVIRSDLPVKSGQEFIEYVRRNPGKLNYGSVASTQMMPMEVLKDRAKLDMVNVLYGGGGQIQQAFLNGDIVAQVGARLGLEALFDSGKVRFLATLSPERNPLFPDVPSAPEAGMPGVYAPFSQGVWAPGKTPVTTIEILNTAFNQVLKRPEILKFVRDQGAQIGGGKPQALSDAIRAEQAYWADAARIARFQPE